MLALSVLRRRHFLSLSTSYSTTTMSLSFIEEPMQLKCISRNDNICELCTETFDCVLLTKKIPREGQRSFKCLIPWFSGPKCEILMSLNIALIGKWGWISYRTNRVDSMDDSSKWLPTTFRPHISQWQFLTVLYSIFTVVNLQNINIYTCSVPRSDTMQTWLNPLKAGHVTWHVPWHP